MPVTWRDLTEQNGRHRASGRQRLLGQVSVMAAECTTVCCGKEGGEAETRDRSTTLPSVSRGSQQPPWFATTKSGSDIKNDRFFTL